MRAPLLRHPPLMGELSYRPGLTAASGHLNPEWKALLTEFPERFLVRPDSWINARWSGYEGLMADAGASSSP